MATTNSYTCNLKKNAKARLAIFLRLNLKNKHTKQNQPNPTKQKTSNKQKTPHKLQDSEILNKV